jgi:hypothetical protein
MFPIYPAAGHGRFNENSRQHEHGRSTKPRIPSDIRRRIAPGIAKAKVHGMLPMIILVYR